MSGDNPSIVVTAFPATLEIGVPQERLATPLIWTVQAPQSCRPQPNFVPVNPSVSRKTHSSGICAGTSTLCRFPFRVNSMAGIGSLLKNSRQYTSVAAVYDRAFFLESTKLRGHRRRLQGILRFLPRLLYSPRYDSR